MFSLRRVLPLLFLCACTSGFQGVEGERPDGYTIEYDYVLGYDSEAGSPVWGGGHFVTDLSDGREAITPSNDATKIHPELKGDKATFDPTADKGSSDWDVFASNWWPMSNNGIAWDWADDGDGPSEKYDRLFHPGQPRTVEAVKHWNYDESLEDADDRPEKHEHEAIEVAGPATAWELENHGIYQDGPHPDSWWGHCNGWASYVTTDPGGAPERDIWVEMSDDGIVECVGDTEGCTYFRMGDIEALMGEVYFNDQATFGGQRCNERPEDMERDEYGRPTNPKCRDINAGSFHITTVGLLNKGAKHLATGKQGKPAFIIDHNYDYQVWNFPLVRYEITHTEQVTEEEAARLVGAESDYEWNADAKSFQVVKMTYYMVSDSVGVSQMKKQAGQRNIPLKPVRLNYVLELADDGTILGGEWIADPETSWGNDSKELHPDFIWMGMNFQGYYENADDTGGYSDNPYISYDNVKALLDCSNDPSTCAPPDSDPVDQGTTGDLTCDGHCGGSVTVGDTTCWCDDLCVEYGDCCDDRTQYCEQPVEDTPSDEPGTCADSCGDSAPVTDGDGTCYCDSACETYGDCCGDYAAECDSGDSTGGDSTGGDSTGGDDSGGDDAAASCAGYCGTADSVPGGACYCDEQCEEYGDCCDDYAATCE